MNLFDSDYRGKRALNEWEPVLYTQVKMCGEVLHERHECHKMCHNHGDYGRCRFFSFMIMKSLEPPTSTLR